jgi:peroxiredoxin
MLIVSTGDIEANRTLFDEDQVKCSVLLQKGSEVAEAYKANGTPSGYLVDADGKIGSGLAMGADALRVLFSDQSKIENRKSKIGSNGDGRAARFSNHSLAHSKIKRDGLKSGTVAPEFSLPRLDGRGELSLSDLRGRRVLLVFSSPGCGPCNTLAPELEKFHRAHPEVEVVMISKGEPKENRAKVKEHGLTFPVLLQQQWEISRRYAMFATPVAYLIDERGVIIRDVAVGVEPIVALMADTASWREHAELKAVGVSQSSL